MEELLQLVLLKTLSIPKFQGPGGSSAFGSLLLSSSRLNVPTSRPWDSMARGWLPIRDPRTPNYGAATPNVFAAQVEALAVRLTASPHFRREILISLCPALWVGFGKPHMLSGHEAATKVHECTWDFGVWINPLFRCETMSGAITSCGTSQCPSTDMPQTLQHSLNISPKPSLT